MYLAWSHSFEANGTLRAHDRQGHVFLKLWADVIITLRSLPTNTPRGSGLLSSLLEYAPPGSMTAAIRLQLGVSRMGKQNGILGTYLLEFKVASLVYRISS